jgi:hypothetical protein
MAFSFGFSGDDIEEDPNDVLPQIQEPSAPGADVPPPIEARAHDLDELVCRYSSIYLNQEIHVLRNVIIVYVRD